MYLHLGHDVAVPLDSVVGVFDLDNTESSDTVRDFFERAERDGIIRNIGEELPKTFVVCTEKGRTVIYISQLASATLRRRAAGENSL